METTLYLQRRTWVIKKLSPSTAGSMGEANTSPQSLLQIMWVRQDCEVGVTNQAALGFSAFSLGYLYSHLIQKLNSQ